MIRHAIGTCTRSVKRYGNLEMHIPRSWRWSCAVLLALPLAACAVGTGAPDTSSGTVDLPSPPSPNNAAGPVSPSPSDAAGLDAETTHLDGSAPDAALKGDAAPTPTHACPGYAAPTEPAACKCAAGKSCDANNCFGGYYCELASTPPRCVRKPSSCP